MAETAPPILRLEGVRKSYNVGTPIEVEILHGIDLALAAGEFAALIGPSGSGKSTLLHIIGLLERPTVGRILIQGRDVGALDEAGITELRGRTLGFIFQFHHLLPEFTALENVMMPGLIHGMHPEELRRRATTLLAQVNVDHRASHRSGELSGGEQQRVALARALVMQPRLLLADEPTGNLDSANGRRVFALLHELSRSLGLSVVMVTHNQELARAMDRCLTLKDGMLSP